MFTIELPTQWYGSAWFVMVQGDSLKEAQKKAWAKFGRELVGSQDQWNKWHPDSMDGSMILFDNDGVSQALEFTE